MSLSLIIVSAFECEQKVLYFALSSLSIFLNSKTNVFPNLNPLDSVNKYISLLLIADSVCLSCIYKGMCSFCYFYFFLV